MVRLIQNQGFHAVQTDGPAFQMVDQSAGRGYQNIQASGQFLNWEAYPTPPKMTAVDRCSPLA